MYKDKQIDFRSIPYERPNQKWQCGRKCEGESCLAGPGNKGNCQSSAQCVPFKETDRWRCTRPPHIGGSCTTGPSANGECGYAGKACQPKLSLRKTRGRVVWVTSLLTILGLSGISVSPVMTDLVNPGRLTQPHRSKDINCNSCHSNKASEVKHWLSLAFSQAANSDKNKYCLKCHALGEAGNNAHSFSQHDLKQINTNKELAVVDKSNQPLNCSQCHIVHNNQSLLKQARQSISCNICHKHKYTSFSKDHREIDNFWPKQRTSIIFDHQRHYDRHFDTESSQQYKPKACANCHEFNKSKAQSGLFEFDQICKDCHVKDVTGKGFIQPGVKFLQIPTIDVDTLKAKKLKIGLWPADVEDQELNPLLIWLLSSDKKLWPILNKIEEQTLDLTDLSSASKTTLKSVQSLIWRLKHIYFDLQNNTSSTVKSMLINQQNIEHLFSKKSLQSAIQTWFPNLKYEIAQYKKGAIAKTRFYSMEYTEMEAEDIALGEWYTHDFSLFYRPSGHADKILTHWYEATSLTATSNTFTEQLFEYIINAEQPGQCSRCHSVDEGQNRFKINWTLKVKQSTTLTTFNHTPHINSTSKEICHSCHALKGSKDYLESYKNRNPETFKSNFKGLSKLNCNQCHDGNRVSEDCSVCHDYHVSEDNKQ